MSDDQQQCFFVAQCKQQLTIFRVVPKFRF